MLMSVFCHREGRYLTAAETRAVADTWSDENWALLAAVFRTFIPDCRSADLLNMFLKRNRWIIDLMAVHRPDLWRELRDLTRETRARLAHDATAV